MTNWESTFSFVNFYRPEQQLWKGNVILFTGGYAWQGGVHGSRRPYVAGGACMAKGGGMHAWQERQAATAADGKHPTVVYSCNFSASGRWFDSCCCSSFCPLNIYGISLATTRFLRGLHLICKLTVNHKSFIFIKKACLIHLPTFPLSKTSIEEMAHL